MEEVKAGLYSEQKDIKLTHPEFGYVIFYGVTPRQREVVDALVKEVRDLKKLLKQNEDEHRTNDNYRGL
tara:strand:+ start:492 stop:698 length:207 start_codon:yes stop_codon:yes gene_type:complete